MQKSSCSEKFLKACQELRDSCSKFKSSDTTLMQYNPLEYAWEPFLNYLNSSFNNDSKILLLGMNPGPFGMAQTGVPFGDVSMVRDFIGVSGAVGTPKLMHPKRPIMGFNCPRSEVSGTRLWGFARDNFRTADNFFKRYFVWNYCPLVFMDSGGANKTPDKLPPEDQKRLFELCDRALLILILEMKATHLIGVGKFARRRFEILVKNNELKDVIVGDILHPSPASPKANKDWSGEVKKALREMGAPIAN